MSSSSIVVISMSLKKSAVLAPNRPMANSYLRLSLLVCSGSSRRTPSPLNSTVGVTDTEGNTTGLKGVGVAIGAGVVEKTMEVEVAMTVEVTVEMGVEVEVEMAMVMGEGVEVGTTVDASSGVDVGTAVICDVRMISLVVVMLHPGKVSKVKF